MTKLLSSAQARAVHTVIVSNADFVVITWEYGQLTANITHGSVYVYRLGPDGSSETYQTPDDFITAYTFLL